MPIYVDSSEPDEIVSALDAIVLTGARRVGMIRCLRCGRFVLKMPEDGYLPPASSVRHQCPRMG